MKKTLILVGMLAIGYANAQTGKVGINTQKPKATLEVVPTATNSANTATTNEGIVAPKLTKTRVANITDANLVEGTLVYVTNVSYTGNNTKVAKITEKGYYYYNGTEWVKTSTGAEDTSIYTANGTLSANRTVDMNGRFLMFQNAQEGQSVVLRLNTQQNTYAYTRYMKGLSARWDVGMTNGSEAGNNVGSDFYFTAYKDDGSSLGRRLTILRENGNVGIGTATPQAKLDVAGNVRIQTPGGQWLTAKTGTGGITSSTKLTNSYHPFLRQETANGHFANIGGIGDNFGIYAITREQTANATTGQLVMNTATGNVAIGQTNPDANAKLIVNGNTKITGLAGTGDRPVAVAADGTLKVGAALQNLQGSTSVTITNNQIQRAALTGDVTAAANSNATTISNNAVTTAKIANNAVTSAKIANGTILAEDLAQMGATNGQVLKWNGTAWAPAADGNTTYTGSTSVVLSGTSFQRAALTGDVTAAANSNALTIANNAVTSAKIADGTIVAADLANNAVTNAKIANNAVNTAKIADNAVTSAKIANGTILAEDLAQMGATNGQVLKWNGTAWAPAADGNTTYTGSTSVTLSGTSFQRAALTGDVTAAANSNALTIANNAVTSAKIADGTIVAADLANNAVTNAKIANNAVNTAKIVDNAVTSAKIANGTILAEDLNQMGATNGQVLKWNGTAWAPAADSNTTYTAGQAINIASNKISVKTPVRTVTVAYTLTEADDNGYVYVNSASAVNVTIPSSLPAGFSCIVIQQGAGQVTIVGNGVTVRTARGTKTRTQYSAVGIIKRATNEATITGDAIN